MHHQHQQTGRTQYQVTDGPLVGTTKLNKGALGAGGRRSPGAPRSTLPGVDLGLTDPTTGSWHRRELRRGRLAKANAQALRAEEPNDTIMVMWANLTQPQAVVLAGLVGATGAIIGGLIANIVGQWVGSGGQRRRQWVELRHEAYAEVLQRFHAAWGLYDEAGVRCTTVAEEQRAGLALLAAYSRASLLTRNRSTDGSLTRLHVAAQALWARDGRSWPDVDHACHVAEAAFRRAARAELGMRKCSVDGNDGQRRRYGSAASPVLKTMPTESEVVRSQVADDSSVG